MGRTVMSSNTVQLKGLDMFVYFMEHFKMTCYEAADEMKKRGLFDEHVATVHEGVSNYMELINKQKGNKNETND